MLKGMLGTLSLASLARPVTELYTHLAGENGSGWLVELGKFIRKEPCWVEIVGAQATQPKPKTQLLQLVSMFPIPARTRPFFVGESFVVNVADHAPAQIIYVSPNFTNWFGGVLEEPSVEVACRSHKLPKGSVDGPIIDECGGVPNVISSLGGVYHLMKKQPKGPKSPANQLLTSRNKWNIFYVPQPVTRISNTEFSYTDSANKKVVEKVKDSRYLFAVDGQWLVLRAVLVCWKVGGWIVGTRSVENPDAWHTGDRVFSRNSFDFMSSEPVAPVKP